MTKDLSTNKIFTTGQIAKLLNVSPRTVGKWFDSGRLRGYRIPGSQDRRIPRDYLIKFMQEHGIPLGKLADDYVPPTPADEAPTSIEQMIREDMEVVFSNKPLSELTESQLELRKLVDKTVSVKAKAPNPIALDHLQRNGNYSEE